MYRISRYIKRMSPWLNVIAITILMLSLQWVLALQSGDLRPTNEMSVLDLFGESSLVLFIGAWFLMVLQVRRKNITTYWLALGFIGMMVSGMQDVVDEVVRFPDSYWLDAWLESFPFGVMCLTVGLVLWGREQNIVNQLIQRRSILFDRRINFDRQTYLPYSWELPATLTEQHATPVILVEFIWRDYEYWVRTLTAEQLHQLRIRFIEVLVLNTNEGEILFRISDDHVGLLVPNRQSMEPSILTASFYQVLNHFRWHSESEKQVIFFQVQAGAYDNSAKAIASLSKKADSTDLNKAASAAHGQKLG